MFAIIDPMGSTQAPITIDSAGNIYGTTYGGGTRGEGSVFQDTFNNGRWTHNVLYSFGNGPGGALPLSSVAFDARGNLYGSSTFGGGMNPDGTLWQIAP